MMSLTRIELTSTASSSIRGKLSWPTIVWFGEKADQYLLINNIKSKLLNIEDGSINKHIPLVGRLLSESVLATTSKGGRLLVGLKKSGDLFAWDFSHNVVYHIPGLSGSKQKGESVELYVCGDLDRILVVRNCNTFYLWSRLRKPAKIKHPPKQTPLTGRWFALDVSSHIPLPVDGTEAKLDNLGLDQGVFSSVAFIDSEGILQLSTLLVTTEPSLYAQRTVPHVEWYTQPLAGSSAIPIVSSPDLLLVRYAPTLPVCAVVINQLSVRDRCLVFVSPQHRYQVAANLKCLRDSPVSGRRPLWIADMRWTYNSLLLMVLTQCGCVAMLSRLGNPLYVTTREMSVTGAFDHLISLLPRNISRPRKGSSKMSRSLSLSSVTQQATVSLSSHPSVMKFLISDGCQVLIFQIPEDVTTRSLAMALLSDARMLSQNTVKSSALDLSDTHLDEPVDQLTVKSSLRALMQVWCLLVSADSWSKELKDVSNEVVVTIADVVCSMISPGDIEGSAVRLTHTTIRLVTMVAIDSHRQHVLPASVKLISTIVEAVLAYADCGRDTRLRLLEVAYVLIRICENSLNRFYSILPMLDTHVMGCKSNVKSTHEVVGDTHLTIERIVAANQQSADTPSDTLTSLNVLSTSSVSSCLAPLYKKVQMHIMNMYRSGLSAVVDPKALHRLLEVVQNVLRQRYPHVVGDLNTVWLHTDILCLEGYHSSAISEWLEKCNGAEQVHRATSALHSILYSNLYNAKLLDVLEFVESLVLDDLCHQINNTDKEYLNIRCLQAGSPVKKLVQSLARFMARYFINSDIFVFPSHNPISLPPLYSPHSHYVPVLGVDRSRLCEAASKLPSDDLWSVGATVRYLLISGLLAELVWFCKAVGDVRSSLCVSLIISDHLASLKHIKRQQVNSLLPEELKPEAIHELMFKDFLQGNQVASGEARLPTYQMILPTALFGLPCLTTQLGQIWKRIKTTASKLSAFVPNDLYLPSPALYCPQATNELEVLSDELKVEMELREMLASDIQTLINLLVATNTDLACCGWLVRGLVEAWKVKGKKKKSKLRLSKPLEVFLPYHITEKDKQNKLILAIFRNTCCILWMLHVRDELSLMLRKSTQLLQDWVTVSNKVDETDSVKVRCAHLEDTLSWCLRYLPFSQYLQSANSLCEVIISICEDLPATAKLARKLSQGITDIDSLAPEVKDRMDHLLQTWQTVDLDPHQSRSLSMYYFECCNKYEERSDRDTTEKHIFSSVQGHKTIGSRVYEYDINYTEFMELFFVVSFHPSLPGGGTAKSPALVPTNRKTLEQHSFGRRTLSFDTNRSTLESTLHHHSSNLRETAVNELSTLALTDQPRSDSPNKSGMFASKRWSVSEQQAFKQMKKMGVTVDKKHVELSLKKRTASTGSTVSLASPTPSLQLLTQNVHLSERYKKLGVKFQWLSTWCDTQSCSTSALQPSTKVSIDLQWMVLALIMVEKWRQSHSRTSEYSMLPPPATRVTHSVEQPPATQPPVPAVSSTLPKLATTSEDFSSSALANAISLHASTDVEQGLTDEEENLDREELLEEMRKHSRLATATQPINMAYTKSPESTGFSQAEVTASLCDEDADIDVRESADSFLLEDSATTVWSSATLPNMSGSSLITAAMPADTIDTEPQSAAKTQQSVSTIGSRKSRSRRRTPDRYTVPLAESTQRDEEFDSMSGCSSPPDPFTCQIPLLRVSKENKNRAYYSSPKRKQKFPHQKKKLDLLSVRDINSMESQSQPSQQPESVKLPLLSLQKAVSADRAAAADSRATQPDQYQLAEIRQNDTRWSQPIPLLHRQPQPMLNVQHQENLPSNRPTHQQKSPRSTAIAHGPALLQQYDESNRQREELISRMIKVMRSKAKPVIEDGKPTHPKYQLLKLDSSKATASGTAHAHARPSNQEHMTVTRHSRRSKRSQKTKRRQKAAIDDSLNVEDLATVSERTENEVKTIDVGTESAIPAETVDKGVQHSIAHTDGRFTDYSYLFRLATAQDADAECKLEELDAAANDTTYAAVQYKAMKLQEEAESRPQMVDAAVMAVEPSRTKTVIVRAEEDREAPVVAPNIIHDLQFRARRAPAVHDNKENLPETRRKYIGVADITPIEAPPKPAEPAVTTPAQPRSQQILLEIGTNQQTETEDAADKVERPTHLDKPPLVPYYEWEELPVPRVITPRARFESVDGKDEGKLSIARNLSNMEDRLEYIDELREEMTRRIDETEMVLPRYHLTYQQRQTQTRLSIPTEEEYATILQAPAERQTSQSTQKGDSSRQPKQIKQRQRTARTPHSFTTEDVSTPATPTARAASSHYGDTSVVSSAGELTNRQRLDSVGPSTILGSARSDADLSVLEDGSEMLKLAEEIVGDDQSLTGAVNSTMLADLLGSDVSFLSQKLGNSSKSKASAQRKEDLKRWRKDHQAKVREKYNQEVEVKRRPEARPFQSQKHLTTKQIKRVKEERQVKRERMIATNQSRRIESAENLLEDILVDGAELLAMERMMDLTTPITTKNSVKPTRQPSAVSQKKTTSLQRGKSIIRGPQGQHTGYTPSGFHTVAHPSSSAALGHTLMDASSYDVDELPLYDESQLLVPIFGGEQEDRERIHQLLYSDEAMSKFGSEMNLSNISDLAPRSEVSGESYLDWDVVDDMVAMLSNRGSSAPSTPAGHS